jgi:hypothetical protein
MNRYQLIITKAAGENISYVDENRVVDILNAYGVPGAKLEDGKHEVEGAVATWAIIEGKIVTCPCRCNNLVKAEGKFRPGHDARLVGNLLRQVRTDQITREHAMNKLVRWPNLQAKLARYLDK